MKTEFYPRITEYVKDIRRKPAIAAPREKQLEDLCDLLLPYKEINLNFICTHNSRRSHLAQIWAAVAVRYFGMSGIATFSGGTEATAFHPRAVAALERAGFLIGRTGDDNPRYAVRFSPVEEPLECFSKRYDDPVNPPQSIAIMTCSEADENCPFVPGALHRFALTYEDPKVADGTPDEAALYDERCRQIGSEMFYLMRELARRRKH